MASNSEDPKFDDERRMEFFIDAFPNVSPDIIGQLLEKHGADTEAITDALKDEKERQETGQPEGTRGRATRRKVQPGSATTNPGRRRIDSLPRATTDEINRLDEAGTNAMFNAFQPYHVPPINTSSRKGKQREEEPIEIFDDADAMDVERERNEKSNNEDSEDSEDSNDDDDDDDKENQIQIKDASMLPQKGKGKHVFDMEDLTEESPEPAEREDDSAGIWVEQEFGAREEGIRIVLDSGTHPTIFPRAFLRQNFDFFRRKLGEKKPELVETIEAPFVDRVMFDIALRWAKQGTINLTAMRRSTRSIAVNNLFGLALTAKCLGSQDLDKDVADAVRALFRYNRALLKDHHIERAYEWLERGHPIRTAIVHTLLCAYVSHKNFTGRPNDLTTGESRFMHHKLISKYEDFRNEMNSEVVAAMHGREGFGPFLGKNRPKFQLYDPLLVGGDKNKTTLFSLG